MFKTIPDSSLSGLLSHIDTLLETYLSSKFWIWNIIILCLALSFFHMILSNPSTLWAYNQFWKSVGAGREFDAYLIIKKQASTFYQDLGFSHFSVNKYESTGHIHKMRFRLFLPFLVATFHIKHIGLTIFIAQLLLSVAFLWLSTKFTERILRNRINTFLFMLSFSLLYPTRSAWLDVTAYGDFFAYFFLLLSIYVNRPLSIYICLQIAFWIDERALVNSIYILSWYILTAYYDAKRYQFTKPQLVVILSVLTYIIFRYYLSHSIQHPLIEKPYWSEFLSTYYENIKVIGFRLWSGYLGNWFLIILAITLLLYERRYKLAIFFSGILLLTLNLSFVVYDVNRAISYGYVSIFIAICILRRSLNAIELRRLLLFVFVYMILSPLPNRLRLPGGYTIM